MQMTQRNFSPRPPPTSVVAVELAEQVLDLADELLDAAADALPKLPHAERVAQELAQVKAQLTTLLAIVRCG